MIYKFRVILDAEEDIFRDIAIEQNNTLEDFHNAIFNAFGFDGSQMASFYTCNESWEQEQEIPLFDTGEEPGEMQTMAEFQLEDLLDNERTKIIYVYDFMNMWTFLIELAAIEDKNSAETYPALLFAHGNMPAEANTSFDGTFNDDDLYSDFDDDYDEEDLDMFADDEGFSDFADDDHNW